MSSVSIQQLDSHIISEAIILIDGDTGQILYEKNMHKVLRPASITKVMTALLALELGDIEDTITVTRDALRNIDPSAASIFLVPDEELTLEDALYAMVVVSAADASNVIAEHIGGTVDDFIKLMNTRAVELGALNTNFVNAHGMPDKDHLTTAYDMALISMAAVQTPGFNEIFNTHKYEMPATNKRRRPRVFNNLNRMMTGSYVYKDIIAGKTGWTISSEYTLFSAARRDDRTLIGISIKTPLIDDKYKDMTRLFDFGFNEFEDISLNVEDFEDYSLTDPDGYDVEIDFEDYEIFSCLIPKSFTKDNIIVEYIIEDIDIEEDIDFDEDTDIEEDIEDKDDDTEKEVRVRMVFSLDVPTSWTGVTSLGEVTVPARVIIPVIEEEEEPDIEEELPEPEEPVTEETKPEEIEPEIDDSADNIPGKEKYYPAETLLTQILKDLGILIILSVILICYTVIRKRQRKEGRGK